MDADFAGLGMTWQRLTANAPAGFTHYVRATATASATPTASQTVLFSQKIEGFNVADLEWGTANAKTATLSFKVRSSLTGTFSGSFASDATTFGYAFTFTVNAANTWEDKTVTVAGPTTGTWNKDNTVGLTIRFDLGSGANWRVAAGSWTNATTQVIGATGAVNLSANNGATLDLTAVQLEPGSVATPFERVEYGEMLRRCQRYYYKATATSHHLGVGWNQTTTATATLTAFPVTMRIAPTAVEQTGTAGNYRVLHNATSIVCSAVPVFNRGTESSATTEFTVASGLTAGQGSAGAAASGVTAYLAWSAEL